MTGSEGRGRRWRATFRALGNRNYRLFFFGQGISMVGTWMQMIALGWLVQRLTGSPAMLGWVGFCNRVPSAFLSPLAGVLVDRCNRHRLVIWAQVLSAVQALALGFLVIADTISIPQIIALSLGLGLVSAIEMPARQAFFVELIDHRDDLPNAIALNSSLFHGARLVGPAVAGALIAWYGEGPCFLINGFSYSAVIIALLVMKVAPRELPARRQNPLRDFTDGVRYVGARPAIRDLLIVVAIVGLFGMPYPTLMPVYAEEVLRAGSRTYGWLMTAGGGGALLAALYLAQRESLVGIGRLVPRAIVVFGIACILMGCSRLPWLSLCLMPLLAGGMMVRGATANTVVQSLVDDDMRGRVMSLYTLAVMGSQPFGSLLVGYLAEHLGVPVAFWLGGGMALACGLVFGARMPRLSQRLAARGDDTCIYGDAGGLAATSEQMPLYRQ